LVNLRKLWLLLNNTFSDVTILSSLTELTALVLGYNKIRDLTGFPVAPNLESLLLQNNEIRDLTPLESLTALESLNLSNNQITSIDPLRRLINLEQLRFNHNQIHDISSLQTLTELRVLYFQRNQISDLSPLGSLVKLERLNICYNPYTDIGPLAGLDKLEYLDIDEEFDEANPGLLDEMSANWPGLKGLTLCPPLPDPPPDNNPSEFDKSEEISPEPKVKRRKVITRCGLGWAPQSQYQGHGELPKVIIYALEFEYDPENHGKYICKTIEIRTGDDAIESLSGWKLYLGTLYNPSIHPLKIPEAHSQITDRILRITPEMLGLETFPCNTVYANGISHPLPGVQYVLKTDENILVDTAYSCFLWGQNAWTTVDGVNVKSQRSVSSAALREMETPRLERYIWNNTGVFITYMDIEAFTWDRVVLSDWLLPPSEETAPGAPSLLLRNLVTTWGALKQE